MHQGATSSVSCMRQNISSPIISRQPSPRMFLLLPQPRASVAPLSVAFPAQAWWQSHHTIPTHCYVTTAPQTLQYLMSARKEGPRAVVHGWPDLTHRVPAAVVKTAGSAADSGTGQGQQGGKSSLSAFSAAQQLLQSCLSSCTAAGEGMATKHRTDRQAGIWRCQKGPWPIVHKKVTILLWAEGFPVNIHIFWKKKVSYKKLWKGQLMGCLKAWIECWFLPPT